MKKVYVKPEIELECFQFTANIATGTCVTILTQEQIASDKANGGFSTENGCGYSVGCYHVPSGELIFTS